MAGVARGDKGCVAAKPAFDAVGRLWAATENTEAEVVEFLLQNIGCE